MKKQRSSNVFKTILVLLCIVFASLGTGIVNAIVNREGTKLFAEAAVDNSIFTFVATDSVTSCYSNNGKKLFGILIGVLTFGFYFLNPILAPFISISVVSLLNNLIDRKVGMFLKNNSINGE